MKNHVFPQSRKKVLLIIPSLKAGGAERITSIIASNLNQKKYDVVVVAINGHDPFFDLPNHVEFIDLSKKKVSKAATMIINVINRECPDIVLSMITHLNTVVALLSPFYKNRPKVVLRETNVLSKLFPEQISLKGRMRKVLLKKSYKLADVILCQSYFMARDVSETLNLPIEKCTVVHNPVVSKVNDELSDEYFDLIALGNLSKIKGYDRLMEIMLYLKPKGLTLGIIGDGPERESIESFISSNDLKDQITLLGFQKRPEKYLKSCKMLVVTSIMESFPNAVLEAGVLGLPTVSYDMPGGIQEIIVDGVNGYLVPDGDTKAFCNAIDKVLRQPLNAYEIKKMTNRKFSLTNVITQLEEKVF